MPKRLLLCAAVVLCTAVVPLSAQAHPADGARTNATYFNNAALPAADPYVLHDKRSGYYYAYSTDGADPGYYFGVYRSADLATWEKVPGGALPVERPQAVGQRLVLGARGLLQPAHAPATSCSTPRARTPTRRTGSATRTSRSRRRPASRCRAHRPARSTTSPTGRSTTTPTTPTTTTSTSSWGPTRRSRRPRSRRGRRRRWAPTSRSSTRTSSSTPRAHLPLLLAQRLPQLGVGHGPGQVHRGVEHLRGRAHQGLVERPERADDADDRTRLPRRQRRPRRAGRPAPRRLGADPRLRPRQAGVGERRRQRLRRQRRREEGPPLGGGLEHAEALLRPRRRRPSTT